MTENTKEKECVAANNSGDKGNHICGDAATVGGGVYNSACGYAAFVGGGERNAAKGEDSVVGGGYFNEASGTAATVSGGRANGADEECATVGGGAGNYATAPYTTIPGGRGAVASHYGEIAYAAGAFRHCGDAQASLFLLRSEQKGAGWQDLYLDGGEFLLTIPSNCAMAFAITIVGLSERGNAIACRSEGIVKSGERVLPQPVPVHAIHKDEESWDVRVWIDEDSQALRIQVRGDDSEVIRWVASVQATKVAW